MRADRLMGITMALLEHDILSASKLAEMFEVSVRTIYRDIDSIELAGIPVITYPGKFGGISIQENYKVNNQVFSQNDLTNLIVALNTITPLLSNQNVSIMKSKLQQLIPQNQKDSIQLKSNQIVIDLTNWKNYKYVNEYLGIIKNCIQKQQIQFTYKNQCRTFEPYQLILKENNWYLHGICVDKQEIRLFKLSRMRNLQVLDISFDVDPSKFYTPGDDSFKDIYHNIQLRIDESILERVQEHCGEENIKEDGSFYVVEYPFIDKEFVYQELLSYGDKCEVLSPKEVRNTVLQRIQNMYAIYKE